MPIEHQVQAGDCITSIAYENGFFWTTLWEHPDNAELKEKRGSPFHLLPGDVVKVPDLRIAEVEKPTEKRHTFKLKGVPAALIVTVMQIPGGDTDDEAAATPGEPEEEPASASFEEPKETPPPEEPAANVDYVLRIGSREVPGKTDDAGQVKILLMPDEREGRLIVEPGTPRERCIELAIGGLDPIDSLSGVAQRLNNLGFGPLPHGLEVTEGELGKGIAGFQKAFDLKLSARLDDATRTKIQEVHGS